MRINENYTSKDILENGLVEYPVPLKDIKAKVFLNNLKVYFFEVIDNNQTYRLYSIINKRSFFL